MAERETDLTPGSPGSSASAGPGADDARANCSTDAGAPSARTQQIRAEIDRTRADMDETVNAIQQRLTPQYMVDQAMEMSRDVAKNVGNKMFETIKSNPLPSALIAAGIIWMAVGSSKRSRSSNGRSGGSSGRRRMRGRYGRQSLAEESYMTAGMSSASGEACRMDDELYQQAESQRRGLISRAGQSVAGAASSTKDAITGAAGKVGHALSGAASSVGHATGRVGRVSGKAVRGTGSVVRHAGSSLQHAYEDYPLAVAAGAFAAGMAAGLAVPLSRRENEFLGEYRDQFLETARSTGEDLLNKGKIIAERAVDAAREEGLDPQAIKQKARQVAEHAKDAAADEARRQGLAT